MNSLTVEVQAETMEQAIGEERSGESLGEAEVEIPEGDVHSKGVTQDALRAVAQALHLSGKGTNAELLVSVEGRLDESCDVQNVCAGEGTRRVHKKTEYGGTVRLREDLTEEQNQRLRGYNRNSMQRGNN